MRYISTRGSSVERRFSEILMGGLAPDGGLYVPIAYPKVDDATLQHWRGLSYAELALEIVSLYIDDIPPDDLRAMMCKTYTAQTYCNVREGESAAQIAPLKTLGIENGAPISLLELSNGPTLAFKDMAMQLLGNLFEYTLTKHGETLNILGATSGDTGSAAEYAMRGKSGVRVFMLSPQGRMSAFQTAQMYSLQEPNIFNLAIKGNFDHCQDIVKAVSNDHAFKAKHKIGTVNSINWARVVAQVVYYFKGYFAATKSNDERVSFAVPSGNFGNVCAGHIARMMGLPIARLVVATNENDVLEEFFRTGVYRPRGAAQTYHTSSPSMDISKASNFERFVFDLVGRDPARVQSLFGDLGERGGFDLAVSGDFSSVKDFGFVAGRSTHAERVNTIRDVFACYDTVIDPHTADGMKVAREHLEAGVPMVVLETAQPVKFGDTIREALQQEPARPAAFTGLESLPRRFDVLPNDTQRVKDFVLASSVTDFIPPVR